MKPKTESVLLPALDIVPVAAFLADGLLVYRRFRHPAFLAGVGLCTAAGASKVIWKFKKMRSGTDWSALTKAFHVCMPAGFALMLASAGLYHDEIFTRQTGKALTSLPSCALFGVGVGGMGLMGWFAGHMDDSVSSQFIEEGVNATAQLAFLLGLLLLKRSASDLEEAST